MWKLSAGIFRSLRVSKSCPFYSVRFLNEQKSVASMTGRDLIDPQCLSDSELVTLIWIANDLKKQKSRYRMSYKLLEDYRVTLLSSQHNAQAELAVNNAVRMLGAEITVIHDPSWDSLSDIPQLGKVFSTLCSDVLVALGDSYDSVTQLADGSTVPVVSVADSKYELLQTLADVMTIQEHFGHTYGLRLAWIGPLCPLVNTYLTLLPRFGISINYYCSSSSLSAESPAALDEGLRQCKLHGREFREFTSLSEAIYRADVIATTAHCQPQMRIKLQDVEEAAVNWAFLHSLPRSQNEVTDEVFKHKNSLVWVCSQNYLWVTMAVVLKLLRDYNPILEQPKFEMEIDTIKNPYGKEINEYSCNKMF